MGVMPRAMMQTTTQTMILPTIQLLMQPLKKATTRAIFLQAQKKNGREIISSGDLDRVEADELCGYDLGMEYEAMDEG